MGIGISAYMGDFASFNLPKGIFDFELMDVREYSTKFTGTWTGFRDGRRGKRPFSHRVSLCSSFFFFYFLGEGVLF